MKTVAAYTPRFQTPPFAGPRPVSTGNLCQPGCPSCGGLGWVRRDVPFGHPEFGKLALCPKISLELLPNSDQYGLEPDELQTLAWEQILDVGDTLKAAALVQETLKRGYGWVYLWGGFGQGKTLILKIAIAEALRARRFSAYTRMASVLDHLRAAFDAASPSWESERRLDWWADLPLLAIDEVDRFRSTGFAVERQFLLFDRRYEQALRRQSVTLVAGNTNPAELDGYLADRILDGRFAVAYLGGESARPGMDWQANS